MTRIGKVLGISGSPRRDGNTELLLKEFLRGASAIGHETELLILCIGNSIIVNEDLNLLNDGVCLPWIP
jgi:hypothetical protein